MKKGSKAKMIRNLLGLKQKEIRDLEDSLSKSQSDANGDQNEDGNAKRSRRRFPNPEEKGELQNNRQT